MAGYTNTPGLEAIQKTLNDTANAGRELLPIGTSQEIIKRIFTKSWARQSLMPMSMNESTVNVPKLTSGGTVQGTTGNQNVAATETTHGTDEVPLVMKTIIGNNPVSKKLIAYSVSSTVAVIKDDIAKTFIETEENMFINGDTTAAATNINGEYDATNFPLGIVTQDPRLEFDGLRHIALAGSCAVNASGASLTKTHVLTAIGNMGNYANDPADLLMIISHSVKGIVLGWDETITVDKYGPKATILTGELGKIFGMTVIVSSLVPDTLDETGVARTQAAGTSGNRTVVLIVNKRSPVIGNPVKSERKFRITVEDQPTRDRVILIPKEDLAFANRWQEAICHIINVAPGTA